MPTIWFIRHGESEGNAGHATENPATIGLTPKGFGQAQDIAESFQQPPDLIITSRYKRTQQTAEPTIDLFPPSVPCQEWDVEEFTYLALKGMTTFQQRSPLVEDFWERLDLDGNNGEGTESFIQFINRVQVMVYELRHIRKEFIAVFSHEQFIRAMIWLLMNNKIEDDPHLLNSDDMKSFRNALISSPIPNGAIIPIQLQPDGKTWIGQMRTSHLRPDDALLSESDAAPTCRR